MKDQELYTHHISQQFNEELEEARTRMLEMGGMVEKQVGDAITAFMELNSEQAEAVEQRDNEINDMEVEIDEECTLILARRQPAASDLRLVLAVSKALNDLERMGDEATKIARNAKTLSDLGTLPRSYLEIRHIGDHVLGMVRNSLDAFARFDTELALSVAQEDKSVDQEYGTAMRSLVTYMMEDARDITKVLQVMWALRSLERIGDHARNIADHVIFAVKGRYVRHVGLSEMEKTVHRRKA